MHILRALVRSRLFASMNSFITFSDITFHSAATRFRILTIVGFGCFYFMDGIIIEVVVFAVNVIYFNARRQGVIIVRII